MKRKCIFLTVLVGILTILTAPTYAEDTQAVSIDTFVDNLASSEEVKRYEFELAEDGDVIIYAAGLQESWDGYTYHWRCTVYEADLATAVAYADVRGYTGGYYNGPSTLAVADLKAGTYYIQMETANSTNPLMTHFTSDSYSIQLIKAYHSASATYNGEGVQTFQDAGDVLWTFDGTTFLKLNDGECFMALMNSYDGAIVPVLIGTNESSVEYVISSTGEKISSKGPWHDEVSGIDYYYSECRHIDQYTEKTIDTSALPVAYSNTNSAVEATEWISDLRRTESQKKEETPQTKPVEDENVSWLAENRVIVIVVLTAVLIIFCIYRLIASHKRKQTTHSSYHTSSSYGSHVSYGSSYGSGGSAGSGVYPDTSFDPKSYVEQTCSSQIYGIVSASDLDAIESDSSLTFEQKEAAKSELSHQADLYY